jgi:uncharacterized iron-regulated membrane protein
MRKILRKLHLWIGLTFCVPLMVMGLTGSILILERESENFITSQYSLQKNGEYHLVSEIIAAASQSVPQGFKANVFRVQKDQPFFVRFSSSNKKNIEILIDPISLEVLEKRESANGFFKIIEDLHTNLLLKEYGGRSIIGFFGIALFFLSISGTIIWWPKFGRFKAGIFLQKDLQGFNFHRNLHKVIGFWTFIFLLIISFAGIYLAFPKQVNAIFAVPNFNKNIKLEVVEGKNNSTKTIDELIEIAKNEITNSQFISVILSSKETQPYRINLTSDAYYQDGQPYATVFVNQFSGEVLQVRDLQKYGLMGKILSWQKPLHTAHGLGALWYVPILLVGFCLGIFSITGFMMWWKKRKKQ